MEFILGRERGRERESSDSHYYYYYYYYSDLEKKTGRCHTEPVGQTQCTAHSDCALPSTECGFVDVYLQPSFGNVLCSGCTNQPLCLVSAGIGQCVCLLQTISSQTCTEVGQLVVPDPNQLCLVSLSGTLSSSSSSFSANWQNLASAQCLLLNQAQVYCATVSNPNGGASSLAVGLALLASRRRRLLWDGSRWSDHHHTNDNNNSGSAGLGGSSLPPPPFILREDEWRHEPCRSLILLAQEHRESGVLDRLATAECLRWREIGERAVVRFNLTRVPAVAFTSFAHLATVMASDPKATLELARSAPRLALYLLSFQEWVQPLAVLAAQYATLLRNHSRLAAPFLFSSSSSNHTTGDLPLGRLPSAIPRLPELMGLLHVGRFRPPVWSGRAVEASGRRGAMRMTTMTKGIGGRRGLFQTADVEASASALMSSPSSWKDTVAAAQSLSISIAEGVASATLAVPVAQLWAQGPFVWPPNYDYDSDSVGPSCLVAQLGFNYTLYTFQSTVTFYTGQGPPGPAVARTFLGCWPVFPFVVIRAGALPTFNTTAAIAGYSVASVLDTFLQYTIDRNGLMGYVSRSPDGGPSPLSQDVTTIYRCDFNAVQHCTNFRRDLGWGAVVVLLLMGGVSVGARSAGIPGVDVVLFFLYPWCVVLYVFGVSPLCLPMLPTCLMDEVLRLVRFLFPVSISWPESLQAWPGCAGGAPSPTGHTQVGLVVAGTASCFRSCTQFPFEFGSWIDNTAWILLRFGLTQSYLSSLYPSSALDGWVPPAWLETPWALSLRVKAPYLAWPDMVWGQDLCCLLTLFNFLTLMVGVILLAIAFSLFIALVITLGNIVISFFIAVLVYTHTV